MERVQGIGGFFFRSRDPVALAVWYETHLGINLAPHNMEMQPWMTQPGVTVFAPFPNDSDYFAPENPFMLNFRVGDLDAMLVQLRGAGIDISQETEMEGLGRFARLHDPEGNPIELWQPAS